MRQFRWFAATALVAVLTSCSSSNPEQTLEKRHDYQARLDTSPDRFDADFSIVVKDNRMFVAKVTPSGCSKRCGTLEPEPGGGYKVTLPIGFQTVHDTPTKDILGTVSELVYWDPVRHQEMALIGTNDEPVPLPDVLVRRTTQDLKPNETAYIQGNYIYPKKDGGWVIDTAPIWYEPVGLEYNMTVTARVTRVVRGMEVCAPPDSFNSMQSDKGTAVFVLNPPC